jgi:glutathione S-transferase
MVKLYHSPVTRSVRIRWLLEELGHPYELVRVDYVPPQGGYFSQPTPTGKLPTIEDGDVVLCESGAIVEYLLERYGEGRLAPAIGAPGRAAFLQWIHFAESTAFPPLAVIAWLGRRRGDAAGLAELMADARGRAADSFRFVQDALGAGPYLLGAEFTAADVMMGFSLVAGRILHVLDDRLPALCEYTARLEARPALRRALAE